LLQATCPVRAPDLIDRCIDRFIATKADSLATGFICKYQPYASNELRRQDIKGFFYDDGSIYIMRGDLLKKGDRYGKKHELVHLEKEENIDIDDEFDFWMAEQVLLKRQK
jgi:N-acylneuraminate cytidylyltransferase